MSDQDPEIAEGAILEGPYWPEPVRVISTKQRTGRIEIHAIGIASRRHFSKLLRESELGKMTVTAPSERAALDAAPAKFRLAAEAHRIRLAYQYDPHFAVSVSQVDPLPHQLDAVYGHLLTQPKIRMLLADDPGAGKTIMGGLVIKELKLRGLLERVLIVTPANLTDQWRRELHEKFGETFDVVNRATITSAYGQNLWEAKSQCITSIDFVARQDDVRDMMRDCRWDLVIVDEAHKMAAYKYGSKVERTARYEFGEFLRDRSDHMLFLTATPHKGDPENFALLLQLLDRDLYATGDILSEAAKQDENRIMIRRLKEDMKKFDGTPCFPPRYVKTLAYELGQEEMDLYEAVTAYVRQHFQQAESSGNRNVGLALTVLQRRVASSVEAISLSLERRLKRLQELRKLGHIRQEFGEVPDDLDDLTEGDRWHFEDELVERVTLAENMAELEEEIRELEQLVRKARAALRNPAFAETKFEELRKVISEHVSGKNERLLVFTEHRDTLNFLMRKLKDLGFYCCQIHGGMQLKPRIAAEREFYEHVPSVMIATEAAGEGINLQFCSLMVNYDIPWNPNRLEQRMGRIHRYKQQKEVMIYNLVAANTREGEVLTCLLTKIESIRKALGSDRVYDVISEIISAPQFEELMRGWLAKRRTIQEIIAEINVSTDEQQVARIRADMADKALGSRYIDMSILNAQRRESRENRLMPEYIERFFVEAYRSFGETISAVPGKEGIWSISRVSPAMRRLPESIERRFGQVGQTYPRVTFDKERTGQYAEVEFLGPGHPLFEGVLDRVLREYGSALTRGAVFYNADATEPEVLWIVKTGVEDGQGRPIGQRLFAARGVNQGYQKVQPYALLNLKAPDQPVPPPADLTGVADCQDDVINWALDAVVAPYFEEISERRNRELAIKEKYILKSLNHLISESNKKLAHYDAELRHLLFGEDPAKLSIQGNRAQEAVRRDELVHRRDERLAELDRERHLTEQPPEILGVAVILPLSAEQAGLPPSRAREMHTDPEIECIAIEQVMRYEAEQGRVPVSVEDDQCGWDITSLLEGVVARYIEVKGRADDGAVSLTPNEWIKARRFGDDYWLYVVTHCKSSPQTHLIQNPAAKLQPSEEVSVVRYVVDASDWKKAESHG